jgi:hypothetical protein
MRAVKHGLSRADDQIDKYLNKFAELTRAFQSEAIREVNITVMRVFDDLQNLHDKVDVLRASFLVLGYRDSLLLLQVLRVHWTT